MGAGGCSRHGLQVVCGHGRGGTMLGDEGGREMGAGQKMGLGEGGLGEGAGYWMQEGRGASVRWAMGAGREGQVRGERKPSL